MPISVPRRSVYKAQPSPKAEMYARQKFGTPFCSCATGIWKAGPFYALLAIAVILTVIRHTRAEEESGRTELVDSTSIGRYASLTAALILASALMMRIPTASTLFGYPTIALILFFTFFYVSITYQPDEVADNLKQAGSFIPGVRAGSATAKYLNYVLTRITTVGAIYIAFLALLPLIALAFFDANQNVPFGGASILILVGVGLETVKQVDSKLQQHNYEGFLR